MVGFSKRGKRGFVPKEAMVNAKVRIALYRVMVDYSGTQKHHKREVCLVLKIKIYVPLQCVGTEGILV